jgi:hypothetical protein
MKPLILKIGVIAEHGFLCASVLHCIENNYRTTEHIATLLYFTTERQIETALISLEKKKVIERLEKPSRLKEDNRSGAIKTAFILPLLDK